MIEIPSLNRPPAQRYTARQRTEAQIVHADTQERSSASAVSDPTPSAQVAIWLRALSAYEGNPIQLETTTELR